MLEIVFLIVVSVYFLISVSLVLGAKKSFPSLVENELPTVSIVVAARNEQENINSCLESLDKLIYPNKKLETIIINDDSTDKTREVVKEFISNKSNFKLIDLSDNLTGKLKGKVRAVTEGIEQARGDIILTTDADCEVNPLWAKTIASYYKNEVSVVNGFTSINVNNWFSGMQAIDFIYLLFVSAGTINLGSPVSCIGNNMSFGRKVYEETGGFKNLPFSITEDFLLLKSIHKLKKFKVIYPVDRSGLVISKPSKTIKELFNQKKRWAVGGLDATLLGKLLMFWAFAANLFILLTPFLFSMVWLYLIFFKVATDLFALVPIHQKLGLQKNLKYFPVFQIYFIIYTFVLPFIILFSKKIKWKDRVY
ncbi:MAG: glycosyltransferase [Ignavibacteria bacterium]|nr:glycosyltransferase [Ignavibacteria bacterium]